MAGLIVGGVAIGLLAVGALAFKYGDKIKIKSGPVLFDAAIRGVYDETLDENRKATKTKILRDNRMREFSPSKYGRNSDVSLVSSDRISLPKKDTNTTPHSNHRRLSDSTSSSHSTPHSKHRRPNDSTSSSHSTPILKRQLTWGGKNTRRRHKRRYKK